MLNFPTFPDTLSTRQLECICCNEVFTVSEDYATVAGERTDDWRLVPDRFPDTILRYQPERNRRTVTPSMRAQSDRNPGEFLDWDHSKKTLVNCPRCGADNRNWLQILRSPQSWSQQFPTALLGYLAPAILGAAALFRFRDLTQGISNLILLLVSIFLAAHIPLRSSTRGWRKLREYHFARAHVKPQSLWQSLPPPLRTGILSTGAFLFLIPFLLYILIPWGFDTAVNALTTLTPNNTTSELPEWLPVSKTFLKTWVTYVLAAGVVGIALGWMAAARHERRIRPHLPRPIFHSVANMTRVVVWEAKRALEIGDEIEQMQWTAVHRNRQGGINLQGLYRDNNHKAQQGDPLTTRVLAQHYEIISDRWGHIVAANIKTTRAFQQPHRSRQREIALEDEFFGAVPNQPAKDAQPVPPPRHS